MFYQILFLLIPLLISANLHAGEFQFTAGASSTKYDDVPEANTWGLSARMQYNFSPGTSGWILNYYGPAENFSVGELASGYVWKSSGPLYYQGGGGIAYSRIWGIRPMVLVGAGYRISPTVFIDLPLILASNLTLIPYIGLSF